MEVQIPDTVVTYPVPSPRQVRAIRAWHGMSQVEYAKRAGTSQSTVIDYELGRRALTHTMLQAMAIAARNLGVDFDKRGAVILPE